MTDAAPGDDAPLPPVDPPVPTPSTEVPDVPKEKWEQRFKLKAAAVIVGFFLLTNFSLFTKLLVSNSPIGKGAWDQLLVSMASIETLASGAAGILLGVTVQTWNVELSSKRAEEAKLVEAEAKRKLEVSKANMAAADRVLEEVSNPDGGSPAPSSMTRGDPIAAARRYIRNGLMV